MMKKKESIENFDDLLLAAIEYGAIQCSTPDSKNYKFDIALLKSLHELGFSNWLQQNKNLKSEDSNQYNNLCTSGNFTEYLEYYKAKESMKIPHDRVKLNKHIALYQGKIKKNEEPGVSQSLRKDYFIKRIKSNTLIHGDGWANGKSGNFEDFDNNCLYRFCETDKDGYGYLQTEKDRKNSPVLICGFIAWLIKHWGTGTQEVYSGYLQTKLSQYKDEHKNDADVLKRDLEREFYDQYKAEEEQWITQSEKTFDFISDEETTEIKNYVLHFLNYADSQKQSTQKDSVLLSDMKEENSQNETIKTSNKPEYLISPVYISSFFDKFNNVIWETMEYTSFLACFDKNNASVAFPKFKNRMKNKFIRFLVNINPEIGGAIINNNVAFNHFRINNYKGSKSDLKKRANNGTKKDDIDTQIDELFKTTKGITNIKIQHR